MLKNTTILRTRQWNASPKWIRVWVLMAGAFASVGALGQRPAVQSVVNAVTNDTVLSPGVVARVSGTFVGKSSVTVGGRKAYVFSSSANQILVQIPIELDPGVAQLTVVSENATATFHVTLQPYAPGLTRADALASGAGWFTDTTGTPINEQNPARPGDTITVSATATISSTGRPAVAR